MNGCGSWQSSSAPSGSVFPAPEQLAPKSYLNALTKQQWIGVLDFIKAMGGKLMISVANCEGLHIFEEPWNPSEAEKSFSLNKEYGVPIAAAEYMNEPTAVDHGTAPNYLPEHFAREQDLFIRCIRENYPEVIVVGSCATGRVFRYQF